MILVDKHIKERSTEIFESGYQEENVTSVSYDLCIEKIISGSDLVDKYELRPNEIVFVKTKEKIHMPNDLLGRIAEKNSRIRQGLFVAAPHYFPGHSTYIFLRVQNLTADTITIKASDKIAQIIFEQLSSVPENTYDKQKSASFNDEDEYRGLGKYKNEYENRIIKLQKADKDLENKVNNIYANVLTIMGLFVSLFSLIMVNFTNITENHLTKQFLVPMNISLGIVICLFVGLILLFFNPPRTRELIPFYILFFILLLIAFVIIV